MRKLNLIENLARDVQYAVRVLAKNRGFTTVSVLSLALGIGVNTALFSILDAVLIKSLPVRNPQELVAIDLLNTRGEKDNVSYPLFEEIRDRTQVFSGVFAALDGTYHVDLQGKDGGGRATVEVQLVSGEYFDVLGVSAVLGRTLTREDNIGVGAHQVAVLSHQCWKRVFNSDSAVLGQNIIIKGQLFSIVGVTPSEFFGEAPGRAPDIWAPLMMQPAFDNGFSLLERANTGWLRSMARLRPGFSLDNARAAMSVFLTQLKTEPGRGSAMVRHIRELPVYSGEKGFQDLRLRYSQPLQVLMATAGLILLLACVNIANLLMARGTERAREIAIRLAMGAERSLVVRQLMTENVLVAILGGLLGVLVAILGTRSLLVLASGGPDPLPLAATVDVRALMFNLSICLTSSLVFGLLPAYRSTAPSEMSLNISRLPRRSYRLGRSLVVFQIALAVQLVTGAWLFVRTLENLRSQDLGFHSERLLQAKIDPRAGNYKPEQLPTLRERLLTRVRSTPGVISASMSTSGFGTGTSRTCCIAVEGTDHRTGEDRQVLTLDVTPGYFDTLRLPLLAGRAFESRDIAKEYRVAIVNKALARRYFGSTSPIGRRLGWGDPPKVKYSIEIIGLTEDANIGDLREKARPMIYFPGAGGDVIHVRTAMAPEAVVNAVRLQVQQTDSNIWLGAQTIAEIVDRSLIRENLMAMLGSLFGLLAVVLAAIGLYGLTSYTVTRRTREIGIRMAVGATRAEIVAMVWREVAILVGFGLTIGVPLSIALSRLVSSLLFGVTPSDPTVLAILLCVLIFTAFVAAIRPSVRAASIDPMIAVRWE